MFLIPPNGVAQVRVYCALQNQLAVNVVYVGIPGSAPTGVQSDVLLNAVDAILVSAYTGVLSSSAQIRGFSAQQIEPLPKSDIEYKADAVLGTVMGNPLPKQTCGVLRLLTAAGGSAGKGRIYLPFPGDTQNALAAPDGTYQTAAAVIGAALAAPLAVADQSGPTVYANFAVFSPTANAYNAINGYQVMPFWGTQRKRGDFGKINVSPI